MADAKTKPEIRDPTQVQPGELPDSVVLYQTWRCIWTLRTIAMWWVILSVLAGAIAVTVMLASGD